MFEFKEWTFTKPALLIVFRRNELEFEALWFKQASEGGHLTYVPPSKSYENGKVLALPEAVILTEKQLETKEHKIISSMKDENIEGTIETPMPTQEEAFNSNISILDEA